ncbi:penicillin acylase family protein [Sorangium sp. So ce887]|uniref:penicillin acylase family protein n=1 Tax=Sorangium sp. So ce887 TaxID=3133324 RepID=UPI003F6062F1
MPSGPRRWRGPRAHLAAASCRAEGSPRGGGVRGAAGLLGRLAHGGSLPGGGRRCKAATRLRSVAPRARTIVTATTGLTTSGYPINVGTSFVMAVEHTSGGPRAEALLTCSQSTDPTSPHFADQTELFSQKEWRPVLFAQEEIAPRAARTTEAAPSP